MPLYLGCFLVLLGPLRFALGSCHMLCAAVELPVNTAILFQSLIGHVQDRVRYYP